MCGFEGAQDTFYKGDWSNGMTGVSKTLSGSSILSSPVYRSYKKAINKKLVVFFSLVISSQKGAAFPIIMKP